MERIGEGKNLYFLSVRVVLNKVLLTLFLFNTIFIPVDTFNLKIISLILLLILNVDCYTKIHSASERTAILFGLFLTTFNILWSAVLTGEVFANITMGYMGYILLLYPIIVKYGLHFIEILMNMLIGMAYFIVLMGALDITGILSVYSNPVLMWLYTSGNAMIGKGNHLVIGICIFLKTSPMLLVAIPYFLRKKKYINAIFVCIALVLTGTRANIFVSVAVFLYSVIFNSKKITKKVLLGSVIITIVVIILLEGSLVSMITQMNNIKIGSDSVRERTLESILEIFKENFIQFFMGSGYSSVFYDMGSHTMTNTVELSYWNLLRQVGLVPFIFLMIMYLKPLTNLLRSFSTMAIAYIGYLVIAYTNPLLYSSTGMTVVLTMYMFADRGHTGID